MCFSYYFTKNKYIKYPYCYLLAKKVVLLDHLDGKLIKTNMSINWTNDCIFVHKTIF